MTQNLEYFCKKPIKSDEEIVYGSNYNFTLDIETLLINPIKNERAKYYKKTRFNKPFSLQNSSILYRKNKEAQFALAGLKLKSDEKSEIISKMWKSEPRNIKEIFNALYRMNKAFHIKKYGNKSHPRQQARLVESNFSSPDFDNNPQPKLYSNNVQHMADFEMFPNSTSMEVDNDIFQDLNYDFDFELFSAASSPKTSTDFYGDDFKCELNSFPSLNEIESKNTTPVTELQQLDNVNLYHDECPPFLSDIRTRQEHLKGTLLYLIKKTN
ncbi:17450_t:CDS:1 [Funneliformis geosporum]|uniref:11064_t:CDS:1 n=1 Tax=Funneliformis geosporum TaxID=1117311 RepID=A0A9W4SX51_9GLOM|nr:17450_t:CDS:1 [Funneliformis geosporum]CAI2182272.1 11064_t:CDS:1 [Funneliformis geosporum]